MFGIVLGGEDDNGTVTKVNVVKTLSLTLLVN